jgi:MFS superfamily sulfate permease-like transporter
LAHYDVKAQLFRDVAAGVAVTFLIIPQGLSYAGIAGVPAIYGLCARLAPACQLAGPARYVAALEFSQHVVLR